MKGMGIFLVVVFVTATGALAQLTGEINLSAADVAFFGEREGDNAGWHMSIPGDVNADGIDDLLIAAPYYDSDTSLTDNGKVYLIFGKTGSWDADIDLSQADASFIGLEANNQVSNDVFGIGDVNNDDIDDFAIGVKFINREGKIRIGKVYLFFGKKTGWEQDTPLSRSDASFWGEGDKSETAHVNRLGDINGDGYDDIIIGGGYYREITFNTGKIYIIFGKPTAQWANDVSLAEADVSFSGEMEGDLAGHRVAGLGDVNGDNLNDIIIGANGRDHDGIVDRGICYIVFGKTTGWQKSASLAEADASYLGPALRGTQLGWNVSGAGDVNGDGFDDILMGGAGQSKVFLLLGRQNGWQKNALIENVADVVFTGEHNKDAAGGDMSSCGDIDLDGYDDFIIGAYGNDQNGSNAGKAYLYYGRETWSVNENLVDADAVFIGEAADDLAGFSVAGGGDINNDGFNDVLIAANQNDDNGANAGKVYLFFPVMQDFVLTSPNGGENWNIGASYNVTWSSKNPQGDVKIELSRDGGSTWEILMQTADTGTAMWTATGPESDQCQMRITQLNTATTDISNSSFSISTPSITVITPNGGEIWSAGENRSIAWDSHGDIPTVKIEYSIDSGATWIEIVDSTPNSGQFTWSVPAAPSTQCLIRIQDAGTGTPADQSDTVFEITDVASLTVTAPNGGENWIIASNHNITWTSHNAGNTVKIELSRDNGASWESLAEGADNTGIWTWTIEGPESNTCLVKIIDEAGILMDTSDGPFTISTGGSLTVNTPNGNETWQIGSQQVITWSSQNTGGTVKIELSRNNGNSWNTLIESTPDDGEHRWTVSGPASTLCLIRISAVSGDLSDSSDAVFTINSPDTPVIVITSPVGGENWQIGSEQEITWASSGTSGLVNIYLSRDNGIMWEFIQGNSPDDGSWTWTVSGPASDSCLVLIADVDGTSVGTSTSIFAVLEQPQVSVISPNGGESWQIQDTKQITWTSINTGDMRIELSRDNGVTWEDLVDNTPNSGSWQWTVTGPPSNECLVRVGDIAGTSVDTSNAVFSILARPSILVTSPNGGEDVLIHHEFEITWTSINAGDRVKIELTRDDGITWETLIESTENDGSWSWQVVDPTSSTCRVKISATDGQVSDTSDSIFVIDYETGFPTHSSKPTIYALFQNYPNPFNPSTKILYQCPTDGYVKIIIYNLTGRTVKTLVDEYKSQGTFTVTWDGRDNSGIRLPSGIYYYRMESAQFRKIRQMLFLR